MQASIIIDKSKIESITRVDSMVILKKKNGERLIWDMLSSESAKGIEIALNSKLLS